jgi:hypothetical protein
MVASIGTIQGLRAKEEVVHNQVPEGVNRDPALRMAQWQLVVIGIGHSR